MENKTRCGYVTIAGRPNAGKSTLLNMLLGQKIAIATAKPQTTRKRITGILTEEDYQIIFLDTPGIIVPKYLLQEKMMKFVKFSISDADILLHIIDANQQADIEDALSPDFAKQFLGGKRRPTFLLINKIDLIKPEDLEAIKVNLEANGGYAGLLCISALNNDFKETIMNFIVGLLPEHPKYYPDDFVSDESERFFVSEIIREKILELYRDEIPYSCEVVIEDFKEREANKHFISATIFVERDSQKIIVIGRGGDQIKKIGESARKDIETFLDHQVYLELRVKVRDSWRKNERYLRNFGYENSPEHE